MGRTVYEISASEKFGIIRLLDNPIYQYAQILLWLGIGKFTFLAEAL